MKSGWAQKTCFFLEQSQSLRTPLHKVFTPHYNFDMETEEVVIWGDQGTDEPLKPLRQTIDKLGIYRFFFLKFAVVYKVISELENLA